MEPGKLITSRSSPAPTGAVATGRPSPFHAPLIDLCFERGFARLTVPELCERAGVAPAAFQSRYADLEDCFYDVYRIELGRYRRCASAARAGLGDWCSRLRSTAYAFYRFFGDDERLRRFALVEARNAGERTALLHGAEVEAFNDLIDEGRAEPSAAASLTRTTAVSLGGSIFNQLYLAAGRDNPLPPESEFVPGVMYAAVLPYLGADAAAEELRIPPPPRVIPPGWG